MSKKIKDEVQKQFDAVFLDVTSYPQWVANIVPMPKKDGKVRMCVDYRDTKRANPKDDFSLPHIDVLVDNTAQLSVFSFMDSSGNKLIFFFIFTSVRPYFLGTICTELTQLMSEIRYMILGCKSLVNPFITTSRIKG